MPDRARRRSSRPRVAADGAGKLPVAQELRAAEAVAAIRRFEPHVRKFLVVRGTPTLVRAFSRSWFARARSISSARQRLGRPPVDIGQRPDVARLIDRLRTARSRTTRRSGSMISRRSPSSASPAAASARIRFSRRCATSASAWTRSSGGICPASTRILFCRASSCAELERPLLHGHVRHASPSASSTPASPQRPSGRPTRGNAVPSSPDCASR